MLNSNCMLTVYVLGKDLKLRKNWTIVDVLKCGLFVIIKSQRIHWKKARFNHQLDHCSSINQCFQNGTSQRTGRAQNVNRTETGKNLGKKPVD